VVEALPHADGSCEFLAVAALPGAAAETDEGGQAPGQGLAFSALPLPYPLPD
jgi:hypothetical protein